MGFFNPSLQFCDVTLLPFELSLQRLLSLSSCLIIDPVVWVYKLCCAYILTFALNVLHSDRTITRCTVVTLICRVQYVILVIGASLSEPAQLVDDVNCGLYPVCRLRLSLQQFDTSSSSGSRSASTTLATIVNTSTSSSVPCSSVGSSGVLNMLCNLKE